MKFIYLALKRDFPEINREIIYPKRILQVFEYKKISFDEVPMEGRGCYVYDDKQDYVFLRAAMSQFLHHHTLAYEGTHALTHVPADFLSWRHNLEAQVMSLIFMMPLKHLPELNRRKHELDDESYQLLMDRNLSNERWKL